MADMQNATKPRLRIRRTPEQIKELLAEHQRGGQSAREFAAERGIGLSTLWTWHRRYRNRSCVSPRWVEVANAASVLSSGPMAQVRLAEGLTVDLNPGFEVEPIAALIKRLHQG
jgi:hypothetical protein